jgi:hypothetical protein
MNRLANLIRTLNEHELMLVKRDLEEGNIARVIAERLAEIDVPQKVCPVCNTPLHDNAPYVLEFGSGVRKKARFDGIDCLETFLKDMKEN